jgi:2'-5' RNA ligase
MNALIRTFVAIELPGNVQQALGEHLASLRQEANLQDLRWVAPHQIHLTLRFFGDISAKNLSILADLLQREAARHAPFFMRLGKLGVFPDERRPRVLWVGVEAPKTLYSLQTGIEHAARQLGYEPEERKFQPHITLARLRQPVDLKTRSALLDVLHEQAIPPTGDIYVNHITIFKSVLTPQGPIYTPLYQPELKSK